MANTRSMLPFMLVLLHCFMASLAIKVTNVTTDQSALLALKAHVTDDPHNLLATNWSTAATVCSWIGVTCGVRHHRVTALNLSYMDLTGTIPPHMGNLSFLSWLSFTNNRFHGSLPEELSNLRRLKFINLAVNNFTGEIPLWFGSFSKIQYISLYGNSFIGTVPPSFCYLPKLEILKLSYNILQGEIPEVIGNLTNLKILYMEHNRLSGSIPATIFNISSLQQLDLSDNQLSGSFPSININMSSLQIIDFSTNNLSDHLPSDMFNHLPNLIGLYLTSNQFSGNFPHSSFKCKELKELSMTFNQFEGSLPSEIWNLTGLKLLYLGMNNFKGGIPQQIGDMTNLEELSLTENYLTGPIPSTVGNLTTLKVLEIGDNHLTGTIPIEIINLRDLEILSLGINSITGFIPSSIFNVSTMRIISLDSNHLTGHLPSNIGLWLPNLEQLLLGDNKLEGLIPKCISNASHITVLDLTENSFSGFIPDELGNLRNLQSLGLGQNFLTSKSTPPELSFLSSLTNCRHLTDLDFDDNPLNSTLPISIGNLSTSLQYFFASHCKVKGSIPREIGNLSNLLALSLGDNELTGTIPTAIGRLQVLQGLFLENNKLEGSIPFELCRLERLSDLILTGNMLSGSIPACLGGLFALQNLSLASNRFTSMIPSSLWRLKDILHVNLASNSLSGSLPLEIGNWKVVVDIDLSRNQLSGHIPTSIGVLIDLASLSLSDNRLHGPIPQSLGDLTSLESLDLSRNNLSGVIPMSLEKLLYLRYFNVSFNGLEGEIPNGGPFLNFSAQSFMGNEALCGPPRMQVLRCKALTLRRSRRVGMLVLRYILPPIVSTMLILALIIIFMRCRKRKAELPTQESSLPLATWRRYSYHELERATDGFSESNLLGTGSFGSVFKGTLSDGFSIAIKVFNLQLQGAFKSFDVECEVLRNVRHRHLVKIISSCCNLDFKALVLDFIPNGSLEKWLYSHNYFLDILQRLNIMIDVASALEYLHHGSTTPVVHCDLKPSNVLLHEDMVAYLCDFGIAKLLGESDSVTQTMTLATIGYMAPEYGSEGIVSTRSDVYSFGILLMETFTRKKPTDEMFGGETSLKQWVKQSLPHAVTEVMDSNLLKGEEGHFIAKKNCISSIIELALECSAVLPEERKEIKDVLPMLRKIKAKFLEDARGD